MDTQMNENIDCIIRFGHCDGHTDCTFIDHQKLMTCGVDSEVRIWPIDDSDDQTDDNTDSFAISDQSYAIVSNSTNFFIACDSNCVKSYSLSDGENETIVCRFTTNATHLDISSDGQLLVASAADFTLKLINLENKEQKTFEGHEAPILSVALDPKHQYIASSSCDGSVRIWNTENQNCVHFWTNCYPKSNDFENSQTLGRICWQPMSGQLIAIPKLDRIDVYRRDSWDLVKTFKNEKLTQISIISYSYDSNYLAVSSNDGIVMIWDINDTKSEPFAKFFHKKSLKITSLKWNPNSSKQICFCDISGQFGVLNVSLSDKGVDNQLKLTQEEMTDMFADLSDDDFGTELEDKTKDNENIETNFELPKIQFNPKFKQTIENRIKNIGDEEEANEDIIDDNDGNEDNEFDIGAIKSRYESQIFGETSDSQQNTRPESQSGGQSPTHEPSEAQVVERHYKQVLPLKQDPFQPGSTPIHFEQRFMVWNSVGIVRCYNTDTENSIDVEFHDVTYHHSIHLPNVQNYTIADLSTDALILATNGDDETINGKLFCRLFNIWDATKEWQIEMPKQEYIEAITCGTGFIAVATDKRFVRILTTGGIQTHILSIAGPVVCLSAFEHLLMIIYHSASGLPEEQSLSMYVLRIEHKPISKHPVPNPVPVALSPKSPVSWAGFTDEGTPCVVDYDGIVRLFNTGVGNAWVPICSTKEQTNGKSDNFFVIGLSEIQSQIRCIFCKGSRFPATIPKPSLTLLPLSIPLCEMFTAKAKHEEEQIRNNLLSTLLKKLSKDGFDVDSSLEECNKNAINSLIKLFALALGADRESLALEISHLMPNKRAVEGAIKYAERQKRRTLAQKLGEIAEQKLEEEMNELSEDEEEVIEEPTPLRIPSLEQQKTNNELQLRPKPMRNGPKDEDSNSRFNLDESDDESIVDTKTVSDPEEDSNSVSLKPKPIQTLKNSKVNPFKVNSNESKHKNKRKKERESSDESDGESRDGQGFDRFYEEMKQIIKDDNSDIEEEEEIISIAKQRFRELDSTERKGWTKRQKRRKSKTDNNIDKRLTNKENSNKITKFFAKN